MSQEQVWVFVTMRLDDSLPKGVLSRIEKELETYASRHPELTGARLVEAFSVERHRRKEAYLDCGWGQCLFQKGEARRIVSDAIRFYHEKRYTLRAFVVMPNHVHIFFRLFPDETVQNVMKSLRSFTTRQLHRLQDVPKTVWQEDYFDRMIRTGAHYQYVLDYIRRNPRHCAPGTFTWEEIAPHREDVTP